MGSRNRSYLDWAEGEEMGKVKEAQAGEAAAIAEAYEIGYAEGLIGTTGTAFLKFDNNKTRLELIEPKFIEGLGRILTFGAEKYEANNWKKMGESDVERIKGSLLRHIMSYLDGIKVDPETEESHLYHAACNLMFLDYFDRNKKQNTKGNECQ